jgi:hypothetical protein
MSRRGEQGEHFAIFSVFSSRVWGRDRGTASLLPLLTPEARPTRPIGSVRSTRTTACATCHPPYHHLAPA